MRTIYEYDYREVFDIIVKEDTFDKSHTLWGGGAYITNRVVNFKLTLLLVLVFYNQFAMDAIVILFDLFPIDSACDAYKTTS